MYGKLATAGAWRRLGLNWGQLHVGANATFTSPGSTYSDSERERLEAGLDVIYDGFKGLVAEGRGMSAEEVERVAKGRVWTGQRASELGLVDRLGGLEEAIGLASDLAGVEEDTPVNVQLYPRAGILPVRAPKPSSEPVKELLSVLASAVPPSAPLEVRSTHRWDL